MAALQSTSACDYKSMSFSNERTRSLKLGNQTDIRRNPVCLFDDHPNLSYKSLRRMPYGYLDQRPRLPAFDRGLASWVRYAHATLTPLLSTSDVARIGLSRRASVSGGLV